MNNLKKKNTFLIFGITLVCVILFTVCDNVINLPEIYSPIENRYGKISISLMDEEPQLEESSARTAFPLTAFDRCVYTFTKVGEIYGIEKEPDNDGFFTMELGEYTVMVLAYMGSSENYTLMFSGVSSTFSISSNYNSPVEVFLSRVATGTQQGVFSYTITFPTGSNADITLQKWLELDNVTLNPLDISQGNGKTQTLNLDTGSYLLQVLINKNGLYAGTSEAIHISSMLTTVYTKHFDDNDLLPKFPGTAVLAPTLDSSTNNSITINDVPAPDNGQTVQYGISTTENTNNVVWQNTPTFYSLSPGINYYIYSRSAENNDYTAGMASTSLRATIVTSAYQWSNSITTTNGTAMNPKTYAIVVNGNFAVSGTIANSLGSTENVTLTLKGNGTISLSSNGSILNIGKNQTIIIDDENLTFQGRSGNNNAVINVQSGGMLELKNGVISGNANSTSGGGVYISGGSFVMSGGIISSNIAGNRGGGVYVSDGYFIKTGNSLISGWRNDAINGNVVRNITSIFGNSGHAVYAVNGSTVKRQEKTCEPDANLFFDGTASPLKWSGEWDSDIPITYSVDANGSSEIRTTSLTFTFAEDPDYLSLNDITLSGSASKGSAAITGTGNTRILSPVTVNEAGTAIVSFTRSDIESAAKNVDVYLPPPREYEDSVIKVDFAGSTETITLENLDYHDIYLVRVNTSASVVSAVNTGSVTPLPPFPSLQGNDFILPEDEFPPMGHPDATEFHANPPPIPTEESSRLRSSFVPPVIGDARIFWVETFYHSGSWVQKQATLRATGTHGNIWVMNENFSSTTGSGNRITSAQAQSLSNRFDIIYPASTNILGYEYGGGPGGDGGKDGDPKIQILIYSIVNESGDVAAAGYFWGKDFYTQEYLDDGGSSLKTNLAEIFYIDASQVNASFDYISSTLIHEFQHMVNFNMKSVKNGQSSESWYNEMLSMMAEDIVAPLIGIPITNPSHKVRIRMPTFLRTYDQLGMTEWGTLDGAAYAKGFAFGAYLLRNYGGAPLLSKILHNNTSNISSVTAALNEMSSGMDFVQALSRFGEAMIYSGSSIPDGALSFDNTVTSTVNGVSYTASAFDIWTMSRTGGIGPVIFDLSPKEMRPHSVTVHSSDAWKSKMETYSITLQKPANANIELYLIVKQGAVQ